MVAPVIVSDSFVIADWTDPGTHPDRPIAGLHLHRSDEEALIASVFVGLMSHASRPCQ
jgi:hypothetical protein